MAPLKYVFKVTVREEGGKVEVLHVIASSITEAIKKASSNKQEPTEVSFVAEIDIE